VREIGEKRILARLRRKKAIENGTLISHWIQQRYSGVPCVDCCGVFPFIAMDFDHMPGETKSFEISRYGQRIATPERVSKVMKEIDKCQLVCANCHRVRTQERRN